MDKRPIGVFDSGVGGLTVFKALKEKLPNEDLIYLGDTARVPYGNKSPQIIMRFTLQNVIYLLGRGVKLIVVACNTSSSIALPWLAEQIKIPIVGVVQAGSDRAVRLAKRKKIGVIGTKSTISSQAYKKAIKNRDPEIEVVSCACPLFVPLVEEGMIEGAITESIIKEYLKVFKSHSLDVLILGCTHYPLLKSAISKVVDPEVKLIDSAQEVSEVVCNKLKELNLHSEGKNPDYKFFVSDDPEHFRMFKMET